MKVLFLSSHPLHADPLYYLLGRDDIDLFIKTSGELDVFPTYDLGISFLYHYKIPASELVPEHTWLNFHPAPLPYYRGRNVAYHAILNGERRFGATLHYMDATFDTGDVIGTTCFPIRPEDTAGDIAQHAQQDCVKLFHEFIPLFLKGKRVKGTPQGTGNYYKKEPIDPYVTLTRDQQEKVRAITATPHVAKTRIGGIEYVICPASELYHPDDEPSPTPASNTHATV